MLEWTSLAQLHIWTAQDNNGQYNDRHTKIIIIWPSCHGSFLFIFLTRTLAAWKSIKVSIFRTHLHLTTSIFFGSRKYPKFQTLSCNILDNKICWPVNNNINCTTNLETAKLDEFVADPFCHRDTNSLSCSPAGRCRPCDCCALVLSPGPWLLRPTPSRSFSFSSLAFGLKHRHMLRSRTTYRNLYICSNLSGHRQQTMQLYYSQTI